MAYISCPACNSYFQFLGDEGEHYVETGYEPFRYLGRSECPRCQSLVVFFFVDQEFAEEPTLEMPRSTHVIIYPADTYQLKAPDEVPPSLAKDYEEAASVLSRSPRASAALSRYCIQRILREKAEISPGDLMAEIQEAAQDPTMPSQLVDALHTIRKEGNLAAHPNLDKTTLDIIEVSQTDAEVLLQLVERLLDFYYARPAQDEKFKNAIDARYQNRQT